MKLNFRLSAFASLTGLALAAALAASAAEAETKTLKGEVVDLMCYVAKGAKGEGHKGCAEKCIKSGGPVGLLVGDQVYLVIADHAPANDLLASKAAQTITVTGQVHERGGLKMISDIKVKE